MTFYRELSVRRDKILPGQGYRTLEQRLKAPGGEGPQQQQYPLSTAQVDIQPGQVRRSTAAQYPPVFYLYILQS